MQVRSASVGFTADRADCVEALPVKVMPDDRYGTGDDVDRRFEEADLFEVLRLPVAKLSADAEPGGKGDGVAPTTSSPFSGAGRYRS